MFVVDSCKKPKVKKNDYLNKIFAIDIGEFLAALWNSVISNHDEDNNY